MNTPTPTQTSRTDRNEGVVTVTSAYPIDVSTLIEKVRARAIAHGQMPTQNRVMTEFKVGRPKAAAVLAALAEDGFTPANAGEGTRPERRLHAVAPDAPIPVPATVEEPDAAPAVPVAEVDPPQVSNPAGASERSAERLGWRVRSWPLLLLAAGAFVSIWGGWVGLGELTGFGPIRLLPGIADNWVINSAITLPIGVEAYAAFALRVWLAPPDGMGAGAARARTFARRSAIGALVLGMTGQIAYHLMIAAGITTAPWPITAFVSALPVVVLGCGAALAHLTTHASTDTEREVR